MLRLIHFPLHYWCYRQVILSARILRGPQVRKRRLGKFRIERMSKIFGRGMFHDCLHGGNAFSLGTLTGAFDSKVIRQQLGFIMNFPLNTLSLESPRGYVAPSE